MKSLKNNAGQSSSSSKILEKLWHVFVMSSSSSAAYEALTTGKPKQTNLLSNFQEFLDEEELCPARFFIDFMLQNVIQNWKMKNFHEKSYLRNCLVSYANVNGIFFKKYQYASSQLIRFLKSKVFDSIVVTFIWISIYLDFYSHAQI